MVVERADGHVETALGALLGEPGGDGLGGAEVGAEQHRSAWCRAGAPAGPAPRAGSRARRRAAVPRWLGGLAARSMCTSGPRPHPDVEVGGLDGERGLRSAAGSRGGRRGRSAAAACRARASPPAGRTACRCRRAARCRTACRRSAGIDASRSGAMCSGLNSAASGPQTDGSRCSAGVSTVMRGVRGDGVPAADHGVLEGVAAEAGRGRPQPQRLVEHLADVGEPVHLLERRAGASLPSTASDLGPRPRPGTSGFFSR